MTTRRRRSATPAPRAAPRPVERAPAALAPHARALVASIAVLLVVTPLIIAPSARDAFRLVKGLASGWLGLLTLLVAIWPLRRVGVVSWTAVGRRVTVRALVPLLLVVLAGAAWTAHAAHYREALADLSIGAACVIAWSLALPAPALTRALRWTVPPGMIVAALTLDQAWALTGVLDGLGVQAPTARLALTATLGNPGDIGAFLVLPVLVAAESARRGTGGSRGRAVAAAGVMTLALAATATLTALIAAAAGTAGWWIGRATALAPDTPNPERRASGTGPPRLVAVAAAAAALVAIGIGLVLVTPPLRARVARGTTALAAHDINDVLTGRLDGWRAASYMLAIHPMTGVGLGGFVPAFADARLALLDRGVDFYPYQTQTMFATPHNEVLSVGAEQGWPGLLALAWGIALLVRAAWRLRDPGARGLAWGGLTALAVLSLTWFPFHAAAVAWPWLVWLAWLDRASEAAS